MKNDVLVKNLDELRENFDLNMVVGYFLDGRLFRWLEARYYDAEAEAIKNLNKDSANLNQRLCDIFGVQYEEVYNSQSDIQAIEERNAKLTKLKQYTSNPIILDNLDSVAFNQEDLADLLDEDVHEIYLCNNSFVIPLRVENKHYIGVGKTEVVINSDSEVDFASKKIEFENVQFDENYAKLIEKPLFTDTSQSLLENGNAAKERHDYKAAMDYYLKAANYGNGEAMDRIAELYNNGLGVPKDDSIAYQWYKKSAEAGFPEGMEDFAFACSYGFSGNKENGLALEWFKRAGNAGRFGAYVTAGDFYRDGTGTTVNYTEAKKYYELAAKHGVAVAFNQLALLYADGNGVEKNLEKAKELYLKAVEKNNVAAMKNLGTMLYNSQNYSEAFKWYKKAADLGDADASFMLGWQYEFGQGVTNDMLQAQENYRKSAQNGRFNGNDIIHDPTFRYGKNLLIFYNDYNSAGEWFDETYYKERRLTVVNNLLNELKNEEIKMPYATDRGFYSISKSIGTKSEIEGAWKKKVRESLNEIINNWHSSIENNMWRYEDLYTKIMIIFVLCGSKPEALTEFSSSLKYNLNNMVDNAFSDPTYEVLSAIEYMDFSTEGFFGKREYAERGNAGGVLRDSLSQESKTLNINVQQYIRNTFNNLINQAERMKVNIA